MKQSLTRLLAAAGVSALLALCHALPAQAEPTVQGFRLRLSGALNGQYQVPRVQWARVESVLVKAPPTIGLFTEPPSTDLPFDLTMVLGDTQGAVLEPGRYTVLPLHDDMPVGKPQGKHGFMVIVPTGQRPPRAEYVAQSGEFIVDAVDGTHITGRFKLNLATPDGSRTIRAEGDFRKTLN